MFADIVAAVSLLALLLATFWITRMLSPGNRVEFALTWAVALATAVLLLGYLLSACSALHRVGGWAMGGLLLAALTALPFAVNPALRARCLRKPAIPRDIEARVSAAGLRSFSSRLLLVMAVTTCLITVANFVVITALEPSTPDGLTYHLPRIMYYLQQGSLEPFTANFWAQVVHPKVATVLMLYTVLVSGSFVALAQIVQLIAFLITMLALYGVCRQLGASRRGSLFAALTFSLLNISLLEAASAQNDMVLTAFIGCALYFLVAYGRGRRPAHLLLAGVALALALGVKATALLALPSLGLIALPAIWRRGGEPAGPLRRHLALGAVGCCLALLIITLPAGYVENYREYGHPLGSRQVRSLFSFVGHTPGEVLRYGTVNLLRYGVDFLTLDSVLFSRLAERGQLALRAPARYLFARVGLDLEAPDGARRRFQYADPPHPSAQTSYWGILGFLLVWPVVALAVVGGLGSRRHPWMRLFALAAVVYFVALAYVGPYSPWNCRYFMTAALFALPPLAFLPLAPRSFPGRGYLTLVIALGCLAALNIAVYRYGTSLLPYRDDGQPRPATITRDHATQLLREIEGNTDTALYAMLLQYLYYVPDNATVALDSHAKYPLPEFVFFGCGQTHRVIPLGTSRLGRAVPLPPAAQFLIYTDGSPYQQAGDLALCTGHPLFGNIYLRPLHPSAL